MSGQGMADRDGDHSSVACMSGLDGATGSDVDSESQAGGHVEQDVFRDDYASKLACVERSMAFRNRRREELIRRMPRRHRRWSGSCIDVDTAPGRLCCIGCYGTKDAWRCDAASEHFIRELAH